MGNTGVDLHEVTAIVFNKERRMVRGWVCRVEEGEKDSFAFLRTERYPKREFRVAIRRKKLPFGSMRAVEMHHDHVYPVVVGAGDLRLEVGTRVCFGTDMHDVAFPVILEARYDMLASRLLKRDFTPPSKSRKGQHQWPDGT